MNTRLIVFGILMAMASIRFSRAAEVCKDCNVIFIGIDSLQAAHVHHLGYDRATTPFLDRLARRGVSFATAISPASWTIPTYLSIFTSTFPSDHGMTNRYTTYNAKEKVLAKVSNRIHDLKPISLILNNRGYLTAGLPEIQV